MLWEVAEAEEERKRQEEEERRKAEEERRKAEEERRKAEEEAEKERKRVEAEREEAQRLRDNLESFEKGLRAMSAEETTEVTAKLVERAQKVRLGEGSSEQGPCWHCWSRKTACVRK